MSRYKFCDPFVRWYPRDLWIGCYVGEAEPVAEGTARTLYFCPVPCIVMGFDVRRSAADA